MRGLMSDGSLAVGHLILELGEPLLRDPKCLVDGITQVGRLELAKQMTRLMRHHDILVARHGYFNMDHRRHALARILIALIDADAARCHVAEYPFEPVDMAIDGFLGRVGGFDVMECDFRGYLHGGTLGVT